MVQENCRYERHLSDNDGFHCYDVTGGYFDNRIVAKAEELEQRCQQLEQKNEWFWMSVEAIHRHLEEYRQDHSKEYEALQAWALADAVMAKCKEDSEALGVKIDG